MNLDIRHSAEYSRVINSPRWRKLREQLIHTYDSVCQRCKQKKERLALHHKTYDRLGKENLSDLELVCEDCHPSADEERRRKGEAVRSSSQVAAAEMTYFKKVHGEANLGHQTSDDKARFSEWLERKEESHNQGYE